MKKILFCIDSLKPGGAEIIMCNTVNELVKDSNLDITVQLLEYSCAVTPQVRQTGNRLSGPAGTAYASLLT